MKTDTKTDECKFSFNVLLCLFFVDNILYFKECTDDCLLCSVCKNERQIGKSMILERGDGYHVQWCIIGIEIF